jgi:hypothetical protein
MSWKYIVIIILTVFVAGILTMVYVASKQRIEMFDDNYYEKEMKYQEIIDAQQNLEKLNDSVLVTEENNILKVQFPLTAVKNISEGSIEFLRQSDETKDKKMKIAVDSTGVQLLPKSDFIKGFYKLRARWKSNSVEYYDERDIKIQ